MQKSFGMYRVNIITRRNICAAKKSVLMETNNIIIAGYRDYYLFLSFFVHCIIAFI